MKYVTHLFVLTILLSPIIVFAQQYQPLVGLPGAGGTLNPNSSFEEYINALYALSIGIAALLAVIKIIIAGVKWMLTDIVTSKEEAKKDIKGALLGLIIVLGAVLVLTVINPQLVNVDLSMNKLSKVSLVSSGNGGSGIVVNSINDLNPSFSWLPIQVSNVEMEAFKEDCSQTGTFKISGGQARCYNVKNASIQIGVLCTTSDTPEVCEARKIQQKDYCENIVNGSFFPDTKYNSDTGQLSFSCIKQL